MIDFVLGDGGYDDIIKKYDSSGCEGHPLWSGRYLKEDPDMLRKILQDTIQTGTEMILTYTYQTTVDNLQQHYNITKEEALDVIRSSVKICREALELERAKGLTRPIAIVGVIGPYGAFLHDGSEYTGGHYVDRMPLEELAEWHKPRFDALIGAGCDYLIFGTIPSLKEVEALITLLKQYPRMKAIVSFSAQNETTISHGERLCDAAQRCWELAADQILAIGVNCLHPRLVEPLLRSVKETNPDIPLSAKVNTTEIFNTETRHCKYGIQAALFALQTMAFEITFGQLSDKQTDEEIKEVLRQAFISVEKSYLLSIGDKLAERTCVKCEIPEGLTSYEAYQKYPHLVDKLKRLNGELSSGTTAVIALIRNNRLFVANVGDSRALLCRTDENGVMKVIQLSCDHNLSNEDELLRLYNLGLEKLKQGSRLGNQDNTRCLGNYLVKGEYKEFEELACATAEPIIAEPEINGGIELDESCRFVLLMSDGLYKSLEESGVSEDQVNKEIARLTVSEFRMQSTLTGVAQAVVDRVVRIHHDVYMRGVTETSAASPIQTRRDDITLLVRNFNYPLPNALASPTLNVRFNPNPIIKTIPPCDNSISEAETTRSTGIEDTNTTSTSDGSDESSIRRVERIPAYVDFTEFFQNVELARREGTLPPGIDFGI